MLTSGRRARKKNNMAGHNKWAQIKRQKGANDAAKSKLWGKLAKRIAVESKKAGGDAEAANVRSIVEIAKKENMPRDNIERAITRGLSQDSASLESVLYESYGPGGAAILIDALTDNRNRTGQEIRHLLSKQGLELAAPGSALWAFVRQKDGSWEATTTIPLPPEDTEALMQILETLDAHDDVVDVYTNAA
jgi:YebC/PmpR family DNA-binding regulatory protein